MKPCHRFALRCSSIRARSLACAGLALAVTAGVATSTSDASAQSTLKRRGPHVRPMRIDPTLNFGFFGRYNQVAMGGWFVIPIVPDGFIPTLNESFQLEFGASFETSFYHNDFLDETSVSHALRPMGGVRYDWYFTDKWQAWVFTKFGANIRVADDTRIYEVFAIDYGLGGYYHFSPNVALRLEAHSRYPFGVGLSFAL